MVVRVVVHDDVTAAMTPAVLAAFTSVNYLNRNRSNDKNYIASFSWKGEL